MEVKDFEYNLPNGLIAQEPLERRDSSRLMIINRSKNTIKHSVFTDILDYLSPGDCLVLNDARVIPARILGKKAKTGGKVEFLLLSEVTPGKWETLVKPGRRLPEGTKVEFGEGKMTAVIEERLPEGKRLVTFEYEGCFQDILESIGEVPLPPYIHNNIINPGCYQTVYACNKGAVAAPTAGLHFTEELLETILRKGVKTASVTLNVGLDSFRPVKSQKVEEHKMHSEKFCIRKADTDSINETINEKGKIIAVGTTAARVLETVVFKNKQGKWQVEEYQGSTSLFIYPPYDFKIVDSLITNFHLPKSTLLMLVSAFSSRELILEAYKMAIEERYRFFSFGDAMLIV